MKLRGKKRGKKGEEAGWEVEGCGGQMKYKKCQLYTPSDKLNVTVAHAFTP